MRSVERGGLGLDDPVSIHVPLWRDARPDSPVTIRDLLAHSSGLPAHLPLFREHSGRTAFERAICTAPLAYEPRATSVYSDLGFMLLGFILDDSAPLPIQFETLLQQMGGLQDLRFDPPKEWRSNMAPTRLDEWRGRLLVGEVDDDNAWALGGVAGHAGLFGTTESVGACARHLLQLLEGRQGAFQEQTLRTFIARRADIPGSSRALGWDTMLATSSCGTRMSPRAFGHVGFTGTSLWIDPDLAIYVVLLTNRVHPTPANEAIKQVRPALHDAVMEELGNWGNDRRQSR
jgi:CubicO group peptidase (beta-lactamase class C family)